MQYFKDNNNNIFAYTDEDVVKGYGKDLIAITETEADDILNPPKTQEELVGIAQTNKQNEITNSFNSDVSNITTALPHEMVSWRKQEEESRAYIVDNNIATPFIDALMVTRNLGETKDELVAKIIANADAYENAYATLLGKFQNLSKAISTATTVEEIDNITW